MNTYKHKDDILLNAKNMSKLNISSKDFFILLSILDYTDRCGTNEVGGQTCSEYVINNILKDNKKYNKAQVQYSIDKLVEQKVLVKVPERHLYFINPNYIWYPNDCDNITEQDKKDYRALKIIINILTK